MNPKKKSRRCRALVSIQALDLAISRFIHSLAHTPPPPTHCISHLWTYDLYSTVHNAFDAGTSITRESGRGLGPGISTFLRPKWHSPNSSMPFHRAQKSLDFQGPIPFHLPK
jgi:hypothetical protein